MCLLISIKASSATHSTSAPNAPAFSRSFKSFSIPSASSTVFPTVLIPPNFVAFDGTIPTCPCTCIPSFANISTISGLRGVNTESAPFIATSIAPFNISSFVMNLPANKAAVINVFGAPLLTSSYASLPVIIMSIFWSDRISASSLFCAVTCVIFKPFFLFSMMSPIVIFL